MLISPHYEQHRLDRTHWEILPVDLSVESSSPKINISKPRLIGRQRRKDAPRKHSIAINYSILLVPSSSGLLYTRTRRMVIR